MRGRPLAFHVQFPLEFLELATQIARRKKVDYRLRQRAALVCLLANKPEISQADAAARVQLDISSVFRWRQRWASGDYVLDDKGGRGRKPNFAPCGLNKVGNDEEIKKALFALQSVR
jgi:hypothetical protein